MTYTVHYTSPSQESFDPKLTLRVWCLFNWQQPSSSRTNQAVYWTKCLQSFELAGYLKSPCRHTWSHWFCTRTGHPSFDWLCLSWLFLNYCITPTHSVLGCRIHPHILTVVPFDWNYVPNLYMNRFFFNVHVSPQMMSKTVNGHHKTLDTEPRLSVKQVPRPEATRYHQLQRTKLSPFQELTISCFMSREKIKCITIETPTRVPTVMSATDAFFSISTSARHSLALEPWENANT